MSYYHRAYKPVYGASPVAVPDEGLPRVNGDDAAEDKRSFIAVLLKRTGARERWRKEDVRMLLDGCIEATGDMGERLFADLLHRKDTSIVVTR